MRQKPQFNRNVNKSVNTVASENVNTLFTMTLKPPPNKP